ncbi:MAG: contact-dependent growth inhibition system immunity protein [Motilibacteraceae bacterium]
MSSFPCLVEVFGQFWEGALERYADPVAALDGGTGEARALGFVPGDCREEVAELLAHAEALSLIEELGGGRLRNLAVRRGVEVLCETTATRFELSETGQAGGYLEPVPLPRVSSWADRETAEAAVTEVLRAHRSFVEAWAADAQGQPRIWMSADLGRELGEVMLRAEQPGDAPARISSGVTQAVVVMARVPEGVFVQTSYPDLPLDPQWPQRFPDLAHLYGGWFGQDWDEEFGTLYYAFDVVTRRLHAPARDRVVAQLGELLALPEPDVQAALHALGSYAVPEQAAAWVERLRWALSSWPAAEAVDEPLHSGGA